MASMVKAPLALSLACNIAFGSQGASVYGRRGSTRMTEIDLPSRHGTVSLSDAVAAISLWGLVALLAWTPLPFGSARPWAWGALTAATGILLVLRAAGDFIVQEGSGAPGRMTLPSAVLFAIALVWAIFQCLPWAPAAWQHPVWAEAAKLLPGSAFDPAISVDPESSLTAIFHLATFAAILWLSFRCGQRAPAARLLVIAFGTIATVYAIWGLAVYWTGNHYLLWFSKWAYRDDLTSTFVNRNSYATYTGLGLVAMTGLLIEEVVRRLSLPENARLKLRAFFDNVGFQPIWIIAGVLITATTVLLTHSRGGATATGVGILGLILMVSLVPSLRGPWRKWVALVFVVSAVAALVLSGTETLTRLADTSWDVEGRHEIFELTLQAIQNNPWIGTGLATFKSIFPTYRTENLPLLVDLAHNDYLENMLELGIPAAVALFLAVLWLIVQCVLGAFRRHRDAIIPCIAVGASALIALQSLVDFSMQIPAVAVAYLVLLGAGLGQATPTRQRVARSSASRA